MGTLTRFAKHIFGQREVDYGVRSVLIIWIHIVSSWGSHIPYPSTWSYVIDCSKANIMFRKCMHAMRLPFCVSWIYLCPHMFTPFPSTTLSPGCIYCIYIYIYIQHACIYIYIYIQTYIIHMYIGIYIYICTHSYDVCCYTHIGVHACIYVIVMNCYYSYHIHYYACARIRGAVPTKVLPSPNLVGSCRRLSIIYYNASMLY